MMSVRSAADRAKGATAAKAAPKYDLVPQRGSVSARGGATQRAAHYDHAELLATMFIKYNASGTGRLNEQELYKLLDDHGIMYLHLFLMLLLPRFQRSPPRLFVLSCIA